MKFKRITSMFIASILCFSLFTSRTSAENESTKMFLGYENSSISRFFLKYIYSCDSIFTTNTFTEARVIKVVDGDTISVNISGEKYKVRMIGIDTPETVHPKKPVQYYGREASNYTKSQLSFKTIYLQKDVTDTDKYGRLLRYIWLQRPASNEPTKQEVASMMYNSKLVKNGFAHVYTYPPDIKYIPIFKELEYTARKNKTGLWNRDVTHDKTNMKNSKEHKSNSFSDYEKINHTDHSQAYVRGNKKTKVYHMPGDKYYNRLSKKNIIYFKSPKDAEASGYRHSKI